MKTTRFVLSIVSAALALAAAICCIIAFQEEIMQAAQCLKGKVSSCRRLNREYEDYADWDAE